MNTKKARIRIQLALEKELLYKSARTCCVCRISKKPIELHHIDQDPSNNTWNNLVVLCRCCHDEAHTKHTMSKNLSLEHLRHTKESWGAEVAERSSLAMLPNSNLSQAMWTYINHEKLPRILKFQGVEFNKGLSKNNLTV